MNYKPLSDHVLIKSISAPEVSKSGIILPDAEKPEKGEIVAVGPGKLLENGARSQMSVKVGDKVPLIWTTVAPKAKGIETPLIPERQPGQFVLSKEKL